MTFDSFNLHDNINKAISLCGYKVPTPVQTLSIPEVMRGKDVVVSAQTGTGKTASFVLPLLHKLTELLAHSPADKKTCTLILTPTRELAHQITTAIAVYSKFMRSINTISLVGGMPYYPQIKGLARGAHIIVATPGRLMDHLEQKRVDLSHVSFLVLDEADRMLDMGFIDDVQTIAKFTPAHRQTLLFSATLDNKLMKEVKHLLNNPARIDLSGEKMAAPKITQLLYKVSSMQHKTRLLVQLLTDENIYKAIIFTATKMLADKLAAQLCEKGLAAAALHGDLRQNVRNRTLEQLRCGKIQFLVATDVAARGIDVSDISHVFNYDLPKFCEDYVHRIGRTGRAGKSGTAISFVSAVDSRHLQSIERYIGQRLKLIHTEKFENSFEDKPRPRSEKFEKSFEDKPRSRRTVRPEEARSAISKDKRPFETRTAYAPQGERKGRGKQSQFVSNTHPRESHQDNRDSEISFKKRVKKTSAPRVEFRENHRKTEDGKTRPVRVEFKPGKKSRFKSSDRDHHHSSRDRDQRSSQRRSSPRQDENKDVQDRRRFHGKKSFDEKQFYENDSKRPAKKGKSFKDKPSFKGKRSRAS